jgi:hypothetical protein
MFVAFANLISRTLCAHHHILKVDGPVLFVACMKCGHASHGITTG